MAQDDGRWDWQAPHWQGVSDLLLDHPRLLSWLDRYRTRVGAAIPKVLGEQMLRTNPKFVLRNHLAEIAIRKATQGDFIEIAVLQDLLHSPFDEHPGFEAHAQLPPDWASQLEISCSS
jgi:uncharacterized protein YdiU (UPF0061 family)